MDGRKSEVLLGRVAGPYGIKGWVKVTSYTQPPENILRYAPWQLGRNGAVSRTAEVAEGKAHGKGLVARIAGVEDRNAAEELKGLEILVARDQLPEPDDGGYYWADLEGMRVVRPDGRDLGCIDQMMEAGAADVMVVTGQGGRVLIPFIRDEVILSVDLDERIVEVDWETDENDL